MKVVYLMSWTMFKLNKNLIKFLHLTSTLIIICFCLKKVIMI